MKGSEDTGSRSPDLPAPLVVGLQRLALLVLWLYLLLPLAFQAWLSGWRGVRDVVFLFGLVTSLLWMALAHSAVRRPAMMHLALAPLYVTTAVDLFLCSTFGARLSSGYVSIALTDHADTLEFVSAYARPLSLVALSLALAYLPSLYILRSLRKRRSPRLAALAAAMLLAAYGFAVGRSLKEGTGLELAVLDLAAHESGAPMGALFQAALALKLHFNSSELRELRDRYSFGASKAASTDDEVYVWIIGESSRPANWSLFGYKRDTTPRLRSVPGIIGLPQMLTTAPHTSVAVPSMLSLQPITDWPAIQAQKSIVGAFNESGFDTYWLSMQDADGWSGIIPQVAAEAKHRRYFDRGFDGALLDELREILKNTPTPSKVFIVLHTKGSHFNYARRYPPEYTRFSTPGGSRRDQLVDTYDNSVLYTDWFLSEVINLLAKRNSHSALIYASDHGENLLDDDKQFFGHALGTPFDLSTAAFLWFSERTRRSHSEIIMNAQRQAALSMSLSNLPHSLLHLAGITAEGIDARKSLFSPTFVPQQRSYIVRGELRHEQVTSTSPVRKSEKTENVLTQ